MNLGTVGSMAIFSTLVLAGAASAEFAQKNAAQQPGQVNWHPHLSAARSAAERSGKPVLVFLLLGRLDDRFC